MIQKIKCLFGYHDFNTHSKYNERLFYCKHCKIIHGYLELDYIERLEKALLKAHWNLGVRPEHQDPDVHVFIPLIFKTSILEAEEKYKKCEHFNERS